MRIIARTPFESCKKETYDSEVEKVMEFYDSDKFD